MNAPLRLPSALTGKSILVVGGAGFLGKVLIAHLLQRFPELRRVVVGLRAKDGLSADERLDEVLRSPALAEVDRARLSAAEMDITEPLDEVELEGIDVVVNLAGNVVFEQALGDALRTNALGALHVGDLAARLGARLVHISTCYVAGYQIGVTQEASCLPPGLDIDPFVEVERGLSGPDADSKDAARSRARELGWPNAYTYGKALGELLLERAHPNACVVRPAIVESSESFPFPGWIEGLNTCAALIALGYMGHKQFPSRRGHIVDLIPVDHVTSAIVAAIASDDATGVYQVGSTDSNPVPCSQVAPMSRAGFHALGIRQNPRPVSRVRYALFSAPMVRKLLDLAVRLTRALPKLNASLSHARRQVRSVERTLELFLPFLTVLTYEFRCDRTRELIARLRPVDRERQHFAPAEIDWVDYWQGTQVPGVVRWEIPQLTGLCTQRTDHDSGGIHHVA